MGRKIYDFFVVDISFMNAYFENMEFSILIALLIGLAIGAAIIFFLFYQRDRTLKSGTSEMKHAFASLSMDALQKSTDQFLKLAKETLKGELDKGEATLEEKKRLIDANLKNMSEVLEDLRKQSTSLSTQLATGQKEADKLRATTEDLRNVLSSSQARGQWGERMVEDILNLIGLVENVNYVKQKKLESGEKPDYTFFLPRDKKVNMDVKFPLAHYEQYIAAESESEMAEEKKKFLEDVRGHIKDVASRGYIDSTQGTVDYVLIFIPNESIYVFVHQNDPNILDLALENHIIVCSPITLYAVVSLIHQSVENFAIEEKAGQILALLTDFERQWGMFVKAMEKMGRKIDDARKEFESLTTTRTRQLEKPLTKIREIKLGREELDSPQE